MNVLVFCPMEREAALFNKALSRFPNPKNKYDVCNCGVGKVASSTEAVLKYFNMQPYDIVVVAGFAAGSSAFKQGEIIMPDKARYSDANVPEGFVPELTAVYELEGNDDVTILTADSFITKESASALVAKYGPRVLFDMEATAICQALCDVAKILVMKIVSDVPEDDSDNHQSFEEFVNSNPSFAPFISYIEGVTNR